MEKKLIKPVIKVHTTKYTEIDLPEYTSTELAELVGIHFGDGGIEIKQHNKKNAANCYCYSKMLAYFLNQNFGAPLGKKDFLKIPSLIKDKEEYLCAFLRGLYRTDGCLFVKKYGKYKYPVIKITTKCKEFAEELKQSLIELGFRARINVKWGRNYLGYDVVLHGEKQLTMWNEKILKIRYGAAGI